MSGAFAQSGSWHRRQLALFVIVLLSLTALLNVASAVRAAAAPPEIIAYQGRILDANSVPVVDSTASMKFEIYDSLSGGTCLWSNDSTDCHSDTPGSVVAKTVTLTDGLFSENLGDAGASYAAFPSTLFSDNTTLYLNVTINTEDLVPRKQIVSDAFAFNSNFLDGFDTSQSGGASAFVPVTDSSGNLTITGAINSVTVGTAIAPTASATGISLDGGTTGTVNIAGTSTGNVNIAAGGGNVLIAGGSGSSGCTISATGSLTCDGSLSGSGPSSGTSGYWTRSGTTLSTATAGDAITTSGNISSTGTGTITAAGLLTGTAGLTITGGTANVNATGTSGTNIGNTSGAVAVVSGGSSSWNNTSGNLTIQTLSSGTMTLDSAGTLNLGTTNSTATNLGKASTTLTINPTAWTATPTISGLITAAGGVTLSADKNLTMQNGVGQFTQTFSGSTIPAHTITGTSVTSGNIFVLSNTSTIATSSDLIHGNHTATYTTSANDSGNLLDLSRTLTTNTGGSLSISGALATLSSNCTQTAGTCADSSNILALAQSYASASGDVLTISNSGTGKDISGTSNTWNISKTGAFTTSGLISANGGVTLGANQNFAMTSGTGTSTQSYSNTTGTADTINVTNSSSAGTSTVNGLTVAVTGTGTSGTNTTTALSLPNVAPETSNTYYGLAVGSGYTDALRVNGSQVINGSGALQSSSLVGTYSSAVTLSNTSNVLTGSIGSGTAESGAFTSLSSTSGTNLATSGPSNVGIAVTGTGSVTIGNSTGTFALTSNGGLNASVGGALTGVASIDTITTTATALTFPTNGSITTGAVFNLSLDGGTSGTANVNSTSSGNVNIAAGGGSTLIAGGSGSSGCTIDASGNLACDGTLSGAGPSTGTSGYWSRSGTTLSPATSGDAVTTSGNISATGSGTITSAGLLTGSAGITITGGTANINVTGTSNTAIGNSSGTFALTSSGGLNATTGGALTGVASLDTIATSATALTFAADGTIKSTTTSALTLDSGSTGNVNLGNGGNAKTITIGNNVGTTQINLTSGTGGIAASSTTAAGTGFQLLANSVTNGHAATISGNALTTGDLLNISSNSTAWTSGTLVHTTFNPSVDTTSAGITATGASIKVDSDITNTGTANTLTLSGAVASITRSNVMNGAGGTINVSGALLSLNSSETQTAGTLTDSGNILQLAQNYASATGPVIAITNAGSGSDIGGNGGHWAISNAGDITVQGGHGIDTTSAGTLALGVGTANAVNIGSGTAQVTVGGNILITSGHQFNLAPAVTGNTVITKLPARVEGSGACASGVAEGWIFQNNAGTQLGHVCIDPATSGGPALKFFAANFNAASTDVAENYSTNDPSITVGEVVSLDPTLQNGISRTSSAYDAKILGVISTSPGFTMSGIQEDGTTTLKNPRAVALAGRVPVKVTTENGAIAVGDWLTSSSTPGAAMKATKPGMVIGRALGKLDTGTGTIDVFVETGWNGDLADADNSASGANSNELSTLNMNGNIYMNRNQILSVSRLEGVSKNWSIEEDGSFVTGATYATVINSLQNEPVKVYAPMSPDVTITLSGTTTLENGHAVISFADVNPKFGSIISTVAPIRVLVTPNGPTGTLYVSHKDNNGFTVDEAGASDSNVTFDWMVVAYRNGYEPASVTTDPSASPSTNSGSSDSGSSTPDTNPSTPDTTSSTTDTTTTTTTTTDSTPTDTTPTDTTTADTTPPTDTSTTTTTDTSVTADATTAPTTDTTTTDTPTTDTTTTP